MLPRRNVGHDGAETLHQLASDRFGVLVFLGDGSLSRPDAHPSRLNPPGPYLRKPPASPGIYHARAHRPRVKPVIRAESTFGVLHIRWVRSSSPVRPSSDPGAPLAACYERGRVDLRVHRTGEEATR
jgi:hypothetical protein